MCRPRIESLSFALSSFDYKRTGLTPASIAAALLGLHVVLSASTEDFVKKFA